MCEIWRRLDATSCERQAADDLSHFIFRMTERRPVIRTLERPASPPAGKPAIVVGAAAEWIDEDARAWLDSVRNGRKHFRKDAICLRRIGDILLVCGSNDESHGFAVQELLERWGCRWLFPGSLGECIPRKDVLVVAFDEHLHSSPFELRNYRAGWLAETDEHAMFARRNKYNTFDAGQTLLPDALRVATRQIPSFKPRTGWVSQHGARGPDKYRRLRLDADENIDVCVSSLSEAYCSRDVISLHMPWICTRADLEGADTAGGLDDPFIRMPMRTDVVFAFYNRVMDRLSQLHPDRQTKVIVWAYSDLLLPPQSIDRIHERIYVYYIPQSSAYYAAMSREDLPNKREHRAVLDDWCRLMPGRVMVYHYDQSQAMWRDLPNTPSRAFASDVGLFTRLGVLGVATESRGCAATTLFNHYVNAKLLWDPGVDLEAAINGAIDVFYSLPASHDPISPCMRPFWWAIIDAWDRTHAVEKEHFMATSVYTDRLLGSLEQHTSLARRVWETNVQRHGQAPELARQRMELTGLIYSLIRTWIESWQAGSRDADYLMASRRLGDAITIRGQIEKLAPHLVQSFDKLARMYGGRRPYHTWQGELDEYHWLASLGAKPRGEYVDSTPERWSFRIDPDDTGVASGWALTPGDPDTWETISVSQYIQADERYVGFAGVAWYYTELRVVRELRNPILVFPALFNPAWLYINGHLVDHRPFDDHWYFEVDSYSLAWLVSLSPHLIRGSNHCHLRIDNKLGYGGILKRPFIIDAAHPRPRIPREIAPESFRVTRD